MKKIIKITLIGLFTGIYSVYAQLSTTPSGGNKVAWVGERIGITDVTIKYNRPGVKGREGKIYGTDIVHKGFIDKTLEYGTSKSAPWRAGANENTVIEFSTDVKVEGKELPAGKYGFFIAYDPVECIVIFSKDYNSWGNYFYDEKRDALRVKVKPEAMDKSEEWLKYEFIKQTDNSATIAMKWEKLMIRFKVEVDFVKTQLASYRDELKGENGFKWESWVQAANFCLDNNTNLEEGMTWAKMGMMNQKNFQTCALVASYHDKNGNKAKADSLMKEAISMGKVMEVHMYGRKLLSLKLNAEAMEIFKLNAKNYPKQFTTYVGLARGYSALGDYKNALANAKLALPLAIDDMNRKSVEGMIKKLEEKKDIN